MYIKQMVKINNIFHFSRFSDQLTRPVTFVTSKQIFKNNYKEEWITNGQQGKPVDQSSNT